MAQRVWTEDETLLAFRLYNSLRRSEIDPRHPLIKDLAALIDRTADAVTMKIWNLASKDPTVVASGRVSLRHAGRRDAEVFEKYHAHTNELLLASEVALQRLVSDNTETGVSDSSLTTSNALLKRWKEFAGPTDVLRESHQRRAQTFFREIVLASYDYRCAVSGIDKPALLTASHIIPWSVDRERRADPSNGISMSALHDRAFDRGLISFDEGRRLLVSDRLKHGEPNKVIRVSILDLEGRELEGAERYAPDPLALAYHRERIFKKAG